MKQTKKTTYSVQRTDQKAYSPDKTIVRKAKTFPSTMKQTINEANCFRYYAAEVARREFQTVPNYSDGEDAIKRDYDLMVRINRDLYQNNPVYRAIINGVCTAIVGEDGCEFSPLVQGVVTPEIKQELQSMWLMRMEVEKCSARK